MFEKLKKNKWKIFFMGYISLFILFIIIVIFLEKKNDKKSFNDKNLEKVEQGMMSRVSYQGHSYIVWSINAGGGCTHDPDCKCDTKYIITHELK